MTGRFVQLTKQEYEFTRWWHRKGQLHEMKADVTVYYSQPVTKKSALLCNNSILVMKLT